MSSIRDLRTDYTKGTLSPGDLNDCPGDQLRLWIEEADRCGIGDANAFTLSTMSKAGYPSGRVVLAREVDAIGVVFYTNKQSDKGEELSELSRAGATFFWSALQRQVRLTGKVVEISNEESDRYFASRPRASQIGAHASDQSREISSREELEIKLSYLEAQFDGVDQIPRPKHWGGFRISLEEVEFWQGRASRLHDRVKYIKVEEGWKKVILQP